MTTEGDLPLLQIQPDAIDDKLECIILKELKDTSPTSLDHIEQLMQSLKKKEAVFGKDNKGRPVIQYKDTGKLSWDVSNTNKLAKPKSDDDVELHMNFWLEHIKYQKINKPSSGVVLDSTCVQINEGHYREDKEFTKTDTVLGTGTIARDIIVVKDNKTGKKMALKTIMLQFFRGEEVEAWKDLNETGIPPAMYCFKSDGKNIELFMEIIDNGVTMRDMIDFHMGNIRKQDANLVRPFSLYVFGDLLWALSEMQKKGWNHKDLHAGNIMLQKLPNGTIKIRILDFGLAQHYTNEGFKKDMVEVLRNFTALSADQEFADQNDIKENWQNKIKMANASSKDVRLVGIALEVNLPSQMPKLQKEIAKEILYLKSDADDDDDDDDDGGFGGGVDQEFFDENISKLPDESEPAQPQTTSMASIVGAAGEQTTLINNEEEAFALPPLDATITPDTRRMLMKVTEIVFKSIHPDSSGYGNTCTARSDQNDVPLSLQELNVELRE